MGFEITLESRNIKGVNKDKRFFCDPDFEKVLTFPNVQTCLKLINTLEGQEELWSAEKNGISVSLIDKKTSVHETNPLAHYFKINYRDRCFFLKHSMPELLGSGGYREAVSTKKAEDILLENNIEWAEVIKCKLGFSNKTDVYYISEWKDPNTVEILKNYLQKLKDTIDKAKQSGTETEDTEKSYIIYSELNIKFDTLKKLFKGFVDFIHGYNIFIDVNSGKLYLFDLTDRTME